MERRGFFKGAFGTALAAMVPRVARAKEAEPHGNGTVNMETIANGPFVSMVPVFRRGTMLRLYFTIRVKIGEKTVDFNHHGNTAEDFRDAKLFMETLGYKQWIITSALRQALDGR
jgi:hypothetical protein